METYRPTLRRALVCIAVLGLGGYFVGYVLAWATGFSTPSLNDYGAAYQAGWRIIEGLPVYDQYPKQYQLPYEHLRDNFFLYTPAVALLYAGLGRLPFFASAAIFLGIGVVSLLLTTHILAKELSITPTRRRYLIGTVVVLGFYPTKQWLHMGQVTGYLAVAYTASAILLLREQTTQSSIWIGVTSFVPTTIKLYHAPANAHLLRSPTRLVGAGIAGIGTVVITIVVFGFDTFRTYLRILRRWYTRRDDPFSATLAGGPYEPMMLFGNERFIVQSALILITFAVSLISLRQPGETTDRYVYVLGIATVGFAVPGVKMYTLVILLPALVVSLHTEWIDDGVPEIPILSLILIHGHRHSMIVGHELAERAGLLTAFETVYPVVQPALWGVALLYGLALWRLLQLTGVIPGRAPDIGNI